jgi:hypothetical protein
VQSIARPAQLHLLSPAAAYQLPGSNHWTLQLWGISFLAMAAQRESSAEASSWAGISESGDDDMDFEVGVCVRFGSGVWFRGCAWGGVRDGG